MGTCFGNNFFNFFLKVSYIVLFQSWMYLSTFSLGSRYDPFPLVGAHWNNHEQGVSADFHNFDDWGKARYCGSVGNLLIYAALRNPAAIAIKRLAFSK